jgi:hypothetical protein
MCNAAYFHTLIYYSPYWRDAANPTATDYINALVTFEASAGDSFFCEFLDLLEEGHDVTAPEFTVEDMYLEGSINTICCETDGTCSE